MMIVLAVFGVGLLAEWALYAPFLWRVRKVLAAAALLLTAFASGGIVMWEPGLATVLVAVASMYRVFNSLRIIEGRMHEYYLRWATLRTSLILVSLQLFVLLCWFGWQYVDVSAMALWTVLATAQVVVAVGLLTSAFRSLRRTAWPHHAPSIADSELPALTVAIPARNETDDLQACLQSLVASNYAKLEILVLDDCSQTKRTPEIIRAFAHDGVRFLEGEPPKQTWLAKNQAYSHLAREASGEYILFCGVDVRFGPDSLRQLMATTLHKKKAMLSLLPRRAEGAERRVALTQAMRYCWELVPPRRLLQRPPVLSTCWIIQKQALTKAGGFEAAARSIVPEAHFARRLVAHDAYSFMRASQTLGIESTKPAKEQYDTAVRMRYPQLHRRPENVLFLAAVSAFLLVPFVLAVLGFFVSIGWAAHVLAAVAAIVLITAYLRVTHVTRTGSGWVNLFALPVALACDVAILHVSMWQYEFSTVEWKGRNICIPAMHVVPHLPKI